MCFFSFFLNNVLLLFMPIQKLKFDIGVFLHQKLDIMIKDQHSNCTNLLNNLLCLMSLKKIDTLFEN